MMLIIVRLLMPADDDAAYADVERGLTAVVGSNDAFSSNCNSY